MQRLHRTISWVMILSLVSHVFCCVLPTVVGIISLLTGLGFFSVYTPYFSAIHDFIHNYEFGIIIFSAVILAFGWGLQLYSRAVDCHSTGCHHEPCEPKKNRSSIMLKIATILFIINLAIFIFSIH